MGVTQVPTTAVTVPGNPASDAALRAVADEIADKGFVVTQLDKLVNWGFAEKNFG